MMPSIATKFQYLNSLFFIFPSYSLYVSAPTGHLQVRYTIDVSKDYSYYNGSVVCTQLDVCLYWYFDPWEMMLKVGFELSLDTLYPWKRVRDKTGNFCSTRPYITCEGIFSLNQDRMLHWNIWCESNLHISEARLVIALHSECPSG
jgi:hypothetical protein